MVEMAVQPVAAAAARPAVQRRGPYHCQEACSVHGQRCEPPRTGVCARQDAEDDAPRRRQRHIHALHHTIRQPFGRGGNVLTRPHRLSLGNGD